MIDIVKNNLDKIRNICNQYHVRSLYVFGSAATEEHFDQQSDVDFLISYYRVESGIGIEPFDYFDVLFSLEKFTEKKVDLVVDEAVKNSYFRKKMDSQKILIYGE